jgi:hypothetical protein
VVVIHPGSRYLRIGKASDVTPLSVPNVIARKHKPPIPEPTFVESITRPRKGRDVHSSTPHPPNGDEYAVSPPSDDDPVRNKLPPSYSLNLLKLHSLKSSWLLSLFRFEKECDSTSFVSHRTLRASLQRSMNDLSQKSSPSTMTLSR